MESYQDGGNHVGFVEQTEKLLLQWSVDSRVDVASLLIPVSNLKNSVLMSVKFPDGGFLACLYSRRETF